MSHTLILWFCDHRWETPPATVNAYYNPARNQISKPQFHVLFVISFKVHRLDVYQILCTISNSKKKSVMNSFFFHTLYNVTFLVFFFSVSSRNTSATILQKRISSVSRMPVCFLYFSNAFIIWYNASYFEKFWIFFFNLTININCLWQNKFKIYSYYWFERICLFFKVP